MYGAEEKQGTTGIAPSMEQYLKQYRPRFGMSKMIISNLSLLLFLSSKAWAFSPHKCCVPNMHVRWSSPSATLETESEELVSGQSSEDEGLPWATHALLFSSFTDGVLENEDAAKFLQKALVDTLLSERIAANEESVTASAEFSPCNGPDVNLLNDLETLDDVIRRGRSLFGGEAADDELRKWLDEAIDLLQPTSSDHHLTLRVLYIPTAMYALNPQSTNTPGKQRQRARADGKKRRTQLIDYLRTLFPGNDMEILATTLDLDDGSLKQPVGSDDSSVFPENDRAALTTWSPHVVYVEGGNTFWLQHCINKGDYHPLIQDLCTGSSGSVYFGKSAGAIVAGSRVATATWKGWDAPSVVPGKETYDDWLECQGFKFAGDSSIFPHMDDQWEDLVKEKTQTTDKAFDSLYCLREDEVCCVTGATQKIEIIQKGE